MAEESFLWTTNDTGDGPSAGYTRGDMSQIFRLFTQGDNLGGVASDYLNELEATGTSSPVQVDTGGALVYGFPYVNTSAEDVAISTPSGDTRIDRIVLRADWSAQTVRITKIEGSEGGGAPSLTQNSGTTWDIPLAQASITTGATITVTDEREWIGGVGDGEVTTDKLADDAVDTAKITSAGATDGQVLTADGAGNAAWEDVSPIGPETFTPVLRGEGGDPSYTASTEVGTKVSFGSIVFVTIDLVFTGRSGGSGIAYIEGVGENIDSELSGHLVGTGFAVNTGNPVFAQVDITGGAENFRLIETGGGNVQIGDFGSSGFVRLQMTLYTGAMS